MIPFKRRGVRVHDHGPDSWGIKLLPQYEDVLKESVEQDARQPEDANTPEVKNMQKKYNGPGGD